MDDAVSQFLAQYGQQPSILEILHQIQQKPIQAWTPQEKFLYQHHMNNLQNNGFVLNPDGAISTIKQISVGVDGKTYNIPTVWDGKIVGNEDAIKRAEGVGWDKWPSYENSDAAEARYKTMHDVMEKDITSFKPSIPAGVPTKEKTGG